MRDHLELYFFSLKNMVADAALLCLMHFSLSCKSRLWMILALSIVSLFIKISLYMTSFVLDLPLFFRRFAAEHIFTVL